MALLPNTSRTQNGVLDHTRTQNPTTVINVRAGITRAHERHVPASSFEQTSLGFPPILDYKGVNMFPGINNNVQPRIGFAYALNSKTAIRSGYGIFYSPIATL
ncbi:MAG TPA: hypothetical protein VH369_00565 [Bryobacteraceae bacterium]|jgi:hypothetical protein